MKNVYRLLVGCIVCFALIVVFGSVREQKITSAATYTPNNLESLLGLPVPSTKQWNDSTSLASYENVSDSRDSTEFLAKDWDSKLSLSGWKLRKTGTRLWEWKKGISEITLSYVGYIGKTMIVIKLEDDTPDGLAKKQVLEINANPD